jgi:hypothetical protein
MTVKELIERLKTQPEDAEVIMKMVTLFSLSLSPVCQVYPATEPGGHAQVILDGDPRTTARRSPGHT